MFTVDGFFYNAWFSDGLSLNSNPQGVLEFPSGLPLLRQLGLFVGVIIISILIYQ